MVPFKELVIPRQFVFPLAFSFSELHIYGFDFLVNALVASLYIVVNPIKIVLRQNWIPKGDFIFVEIFKESERRMHALGALLTDFGVNRVCFRPSDGIISG